VLFITPLVASLMGLACMSVTQRLLVGRGKGVLAGLWAIPVVVGVIDCGVTMTLIHPYQYAFFNRAVGGISGTAEHFDTDYWGTAYREATEALVAYLTDHPDGITDRRVRVAMTPPHNAIFEREKKVVIPPGPMVAYYLPKGYVLVEPYEWPDYFVAIKRSGFLEMIPGEEILRIERDGVPLARATRAPPSAETPTGAP